MPADEAEDRPRKRRGASVLVWVMLAMLIVGLGGFSITNFGGRLTAIGRVGDRDISAQDYANAFRAEVNAFAAQVGQPVTGAQALQFGLDSKVRQDLVDAAALDNEAARLGISVGDARVAREITGIAAFQGVGGTFDRETYRFTLERNNLTEARFEARMRDDLARTLLTGAVSGGFAAPDVLTDTLLAYVGERRGFTLLRLTEADLPAPVPAPTPDEIARHYNDNIAAFTRPEGRRVTYVALLPADVATTTEIDEAAIRDLYDSRIAEFVQPERRLVERLVFPDQAAADAAKARLGAGEAFDQLVIDRGLTLADVDLGDVARDELGAAGEAIFALAEPGVVGPLASDIGPAVYRMNGILAAQETPFEEVREDLKAELAADAARRAIADRREAIDDDLAGGATLEDLARDQGMTLGTIDLFPDSDADIAGYPAFREAAAAAGEGDFPDLIDLDDGGLAALRLDEILPPAPIPLAEAEPQVAQAWRAAALARALSDRAITIKSEVEGGANLGTYGILDVTPRIARDGFVDGAPDSLLPAVFEMQPGQVRVIEGPDFTALVRLDTVLPADPADPDRAPLRDGIAAQAEAALSADALALFTAAQTRAGGIALDEAAIAAIHAQMQQ
ncbi:MAG: peptidyl-prolyl cis-trans isomerase [Gemmobacter sp.]